VLTQDRVGGHLRPDLYGHIPTYIDRHGLEAGADLARFEIAHVQAIKELIAKENIDCDFTLTRTVDVWTNQAAADKAKAVYDMMVAHGLDYMKDVQFTLGKNAEGVRNLDNRVYLRLVTDYYRSRASKMPKRARLTRPDQCGHINSYCTSSNHR
jgi:hypothetical protein